MCGDFDFVECYAVQQAV